MYIRTFKLLAKNIFYNPHKIMLASVAVILSLFTVIGGGAGFALALIIGRCSMEERKISVKKIFKEDLKKIWLKATVLYFADIFLAALICAAAASMGKSHGIMLALRIFYMLIDAVLLCQGIYRWGLLVCNPQLSVKDCFLKAYRMFTGELCSSFFTVMSYLTLCMLLMFFKIVALLILPGLTAFLCIAAYKEGIKKYLPRQIYGGNYD